MKFYQFAIYMLLSYIISFPIVASSDERDERGEGELTRLLLHEAASEKGKELAYSTYSRSSVRYSQSTSSKNKTTFLVKEVPANSSVTVGRSVNVGSVEVVSQSINDEDPPEIRPRPDESQIFSDDREKKFTPFPSRATTLDESYDSKTFCNLATKSDEIIFKPDSKPQKIVSTVSTIVGLILGGAPGHPATGAFMEFVADLLKVRPNTGYAKALIAYTTISTFPAFAAQFAGRIHIILQSIVDKFFYPNKYTYEVEKTDNYAEDDIENSDSDVDDAKSLRVESLTLGPEKEEHEIEVIGAKTSYKDLQNKSEQEPLLFEDHPLHYLGKGLLVLTCLFEAGLLGDQLFDIEKEYLLSYGFGFLIPVLAVSMGEHLYTIGEQGLYEWFYDFVYSNSSKSKVENEKYRRIRRVLLEDLERTDKYVVTNPSLVDLKLIRGEGVKNKKFVEATYKLVFKKSIPNFFKFSALLTPAPETQDITIRDSDTLKPTSLKYRILEVMTQSIIFGGQYARFRTSQYMFEAFLTGVSVNPDTAFWISNAVAGCITLNRLFAEYRMHHKNFQKLGNISWYSFWQSLGDKKAIRKTSELFSFINAVLFSLIYTEIGSHALSNDTTATKAFILGLGHLLNVSLFLDFFNEKNQEGITAVGTAASSCSSENKSVALRRGIQESTKLIERANTKTISKIAEGLGIQ